MKTMQPITNSESFEAKQQQLKSEMLPSTWLKLEYDELKKRNHRYSLRSFAAALKISSGRLSEYLSNKRQITFDIGKKMADNLNFDSTLASDFEDRIIKYRQERSHFKKVVSKRLNNTELSPAEKQDLSEIINDPRYFAILKLFTQAHFESSSEYILKRISASTEGVERLLNRLEYHRLIDRSQPQWKLGYFANGIFSKVNAQLTPELTQIINISPEKAALATQLIKEFHQNLIKTLGENNNGTSTCQIRIQLLRN